MRTRLNWPGRAMIMLALLASLALPALFTSPTAEAASLLSKVTSSGSVTGGRQITIRVTLTQPAPPSGVFFNITSNSPLIRVPSAIVVPGGATSVAVKASTVPTFTTTLVTMTVGTSAAFKSTTTLVKEPYLSSLSLQSVIRAGGYGKVTPRISGPAPTGGVTVTLSADPSGILNVPVTVVIPAGQTAAYMVVPASMVDSEVAVTVTASYDGRTISKPTVVRKMT